MLDQSKAISFQINKAFNVSYNFTEHFFNKRKKFNFGNMIQYPIYPKYKATDRNWLNTKWRWEPASLALFNNNIIHLAALKISLIDIILSLV